MEAQQLQSHQFVVCLNNIGYEASLEVSKIYRVINDEDAKADGLIRLIDESGEDYAFSESRFCPIEVPQPVAEILLSA